MNKKMPDAEKLARALDDHLTERDEEQGCALRCGYHGDDRAQHLAEVVLAAFDMLRAEVWDEGWDVGVSHGIAYQAGNSAALARPRNPYRDQP